jgi:hypothetical protein
MQGEGTGHGEGRRFLIATAIAHYSRAPRWDRPGLVEARKEIIGLFTGALGYQHVSDLGLNLAGALGVTVQRVLERMEE